MQGGRRPRWEVVMRMDALDAQVLDWSKNAEEKEEEEERDPHVEMRRRERLVRFLWGDEAEDDAADSPFSSASQQQPSERTPSCGRVSCLLCQAFPSHLPRRKFLLLKCYDYRLERLAARTRRREFATCGGKGDECCGREGM